MPSPTSSSAILPPPSSSFAPTPPSPCALISSSSMFAGRRRLRRGYSSHPSLFVMNLICWIGVMSKMRDLIRFFSKEIKPLLYGVLRGSNACVLGYGARRSGKTHTIQGSEENPGLAPMAVFEQ